MSDELSHEKEKFCNLHQSINKLSLFNSASISQQTNCNLVAKRQNSQIGGGD